MNLSMYFRNVLLCPLKKHPDGWNSFQVGFWSVHDAVLLNNFIKHGQIPSVEYFFEISTCHIFGT
jgi:hypothetical protein